MQILRTDKRKKERRGKKVGFPILSQLDLKQNYL